jgi:hypothetical protein
MRIVTSLKPTTPSAGAGAAAQVPTHFLSGIAASVTLLSVIVPPRSARPQWF